MRLFLKVFPVQIKIAIFYGTYIDHTAFWIYIAYATNLTVFWLCGQFHAVAV